MSLPFKPSYLTNLITGNLPKDTVFMALARETEVTFNSPVDGTIDYTNLVTNAPYTRKEYVNVIVPYWFDPILETRRYLRRKLNNSGLSGAFVNEEQRKNQAAINKFYRAWNEYRESVKHPSNYWVYLST